MIVEVLDKKTMITYSNRDKTNNRISSIHFNDKGEIFCIQLLNGKWITKNFEIIVTKPYLTRANVIIREEIK